jgi:hypothetical protein
MRFDAPPSTAALPAGAAMLPSAAGATLLLAAGVMLLLACASTPDAVAMRYRLAESGPHWDVVGEDRVLEDVQERYADFFEVVLDPARGDDPPILALRRDLEHLPVDRRNFDALNAVAIGYYELNFRGEQARASRSIGFMTAGFRSAKLAALPWRAYPEIDDGPLRDAILDFYEDVGKSRKLGAHATASRLARIVASLERHEADPERLARIERISSQLETPAD